MKRFTTKALGAASLGIALAVLTAAAPASKPAAPPAGTKPASTAAPKLQSVTLAIRHRIFHEFADQRTAVLNKDFVVGDTEMTGRVVQYVPDFMMDLKNGKITSRSPEPRNPAFKIIVRDKGKAVDTTWAMLSLPPHFARKSYLAFKVMRIDFVGREPLLADSAQSAKELEALKDAARKAAPPEADGPPPLTTNPHGSMPMPPPGTVSPHGGMSPHGGTSPHGGVTTVPSHQSTTETK
jgi:hypothetical protein